MSTPDDPNTDPLVIEAERIARLMLDPRQDFLIRLIRRAVENELHDWVRDQQFLE